MNSYKQSLENTPTKKLVEDIYTTIAEVFPNIDEDERDRIAVDIATNDEVLDKLLPRIIPQSLAEIQCISTLFSRNHLYDFLYSVNTCRVIARMIAKNRIKISYSDVE